ncbi:MAG: sodium:glutamate symporter [FCB group bacterium]|nr:sodium:glutamate symporter [FCB group bacterium]MBL7027358.1 sodium:glutamate symporter [Candidatus Neomarinimicrobiota bacterium]MBL7122691.1 sodium:glutamate symporter [Candidatus Neomarinimicrobiota bacterium]
MNFPWNMFLDLGVISMALLLATFIRTRVTFFQKYLIPNALTAGFILLPFYNFLAPYVGMSEIGLGAIVFHLLSISFIAMSLRKPAYTKRKGDKSVFGTSTAIISQFSLQSLVGLLLTFFFMSTIMQELFPAFGFLMPLGFAQGPGQAYAIGEGWVKFGFEGAPDIGLTFAAVGYMWASFGGVILINMGIKRGWIGAAHIEKIKAKRFRSGVMGRGAELQVGSRLTTESEAIDSASYNMAVVLMVYLLTFLLLKGLGLVLSMAGNLGNELAVNLWAISFVFAAIVALIVKTLMIKLKLEHTLDNGSLTRIAGNSVDIMVAAAVGAISLTVVVQYWMPILVISLVGGFVTLISVLWLSSRIFEEYKFHRALIIFGACTGTMPTGLALLRVVDPDFETPVATDYMYSAALTFFLVIPFILSINLPAYSVARDNPMLFWAAIGISLAYLVYVLIAHKVISGKRAFAKFTTLWYEK